MPRLRSQTRKPALRLLPREVLARCIEFLPFDQALETKHASKEFRSAARRAVAHGRWRPVKFVAERGLDLVSFPHYDSVSAAALSTFRAAWEIDAGQVVREIAEWDDGIRGDDGFHAAVFLQLVEPTIDGLPRVLAACERTHRSVESPLANGDWRNYYYRLRDAPQTLRRMLPVHMLVRWSGRVGRPLRLNFDHDEDNDSCLFIASWFDNAQDLLNTEHFGYALFGSGLEAWDDPRLAARFVFALLLEQLDPDIEFVDISDHQRWSRDWQVRDKADAFVEAARALRVYGVPVSEGY